MAVTDSIAELLTKIRNAARAEHRFADVHYSNMRRDILTILKEKGYIDNFTVNTETKEIRIFLRFNRKRKNVIQMLKRVSGPLFHSFQLPQADRTFSSLWDQQKTENIRDVSNHRYYFLLWRNQF